MMVRCYDDDDSDDEYDDGYEDDGGDMWGMIILL